MERDRKCFCPQEKSPNFVKGKINKRFGLQIISKNTTDKLRNGGARAPKKQDPKAAFRSDILETIYFNKK